MASLRTGCWTESWTADPMRLYPFSGYTAGVGCFWCELASSRQLAIHHFLESIDGTCECGGRVHSMIHPHNSAKCTGVRLLGLGPQEQADLVALYVELS
jgi:hypothetical protein